LGNANRGFPSIGRPTDTDTNAGPNANPDPDANTGPNANTDPKANTDPNTNANTGTNGNTDTDAGTNADADPRTDADPDFPEVCSRVLRYSTDGADDGGSDISDGAGGWEPERGDCRMERYNCTG